MPATADRWPDVGAAFGPRGNDPGSCWCQRFRRHAEPDNRAALQREITSARTPVGLLAVVAGDVVGWTRAVPRATLPGITQNRALARILDEDPDAWWVSCFAVRRERRGLGVGTALLRGATDWAFAHGASLLEGHPVDTDALRGPASPSAVFTGTSQMFVDAGFSEVGRTYPSRPVMRRAAHRAP